MVRSGVRRDVRCAQGSGGQGQKAAARDSPPTLGHQNAPQPPSPPHPATSIHNHIDRGGCSLQIPLHCATADLPHTPVVLLLGPGRSLLPWPLHSRGGGGMRARSVYATPPPRVLRDSAARVTAPTAPFFLHLSSRGARCLVLLLLPSKGVPCVWSLFCFVQPSDTPCACPLALAPRSSGSIPMPLIHAQLQWQPRPCAACDRALAQCQRSAIPARAGWAPSSAKWLWNSDPNADEEAAAYGASNWEVFKCLQWPHPPRLAGSDHRHGHHGRTRFCGPLAVFRRDTCVGLQICPPLLFFWGVQAMMSCRSLLVTRHLRNLSESRISPVLRWSHKAVW